MKFPIENGNRILVDGEQLNADKHQVREFVEISVFLAYSVFQMGEVRPM